VEEDETAFAPKTGGACLRQLTPPKPTETRSSSLRISRSGIFRAVPVVDTDLKFHKLWAQTKVEVELSNYANLVQRMRENLNENPKR
jgi:hypothetical protein